MLSESGRMNPGPWVDHSRHVAEAARGLAIALGDMDPERMYVCGLLHDIGRRCGRTKMRHIIDGYRYLTDLGYEEPARICLTHSFPIQNTNAIFGEWDCTPEERAEVDRMVDGFTYTTVDELFQLCDALALPSGCVLLEKRMMDVALRHGTNDWTVEKWKATFRIQRKFEERLGRSIYEHLPGVVENTFGSLTR